MNFLGYFLGYAFFCGMIWSLRVPADLFLPIGLAIILIICFLPKAPAITEDNR